MKIGLPIALLLTIAGASASAAEDVVWNAPRTLNAVSFNPQAGLDSQRVYRWQTVVKAANQEISEAVAAGEIKPERVRLKFPSGGWLEFEPSHDAVASDALPRILAMQFREGRAAESAKKKPSS